MVNGDAGRAEAERRFGKPQTRQQTSAGTGVGHPGRGQWTMEDLFEPGARGAAHAAVRAGDASAATALADLARTVERIKISTQSGGSSAA